MGNLEVAETLLVPVQHKETAAQVVKHSGSIHCLQTH